MKKNTLLSTFIFLCSISIFGQQAIDNTYRIKINAFLTNVYYETLHSKATVQIDSTAVNNRKKTVELYVNPALSYLPMRENTVRHIYDSVRQYLPEQIKKYRLAIYSDKQEISSLIPNFYRTAHKDKSRIIAPKVKTPLVTNLSDPAGKAGKGLANNHIALWQSHGYYYEQKLGRWEWQRARIFQTVEDLYTQSYVVPFLVPMLENAGANVLLPRERDYNKTELIIDNDGSSPATTYRETSGNEAWRNTENPGFANPKKVYLDGENPFRMGSARQVKTIAKGKESVVEWSFDVPRKDTYGVYVAYQSTKNSADDARYTVHHAGGETRFAVNQQMGGGTWIFLGYFPFEPGKENKVVLSNKSQKAGRTIVADAVKVGGGMGNIARMPNVRGFESTNAKSSESATHTQTSVTAIPYSPETSGYPRYAEGSRYWQQWAGIPDSIYNRSEGKNDYTDDYASRGVWVNYLAGGSPVLPKAEGLKIPIDLAFAFHSDAGTLWGDSIVGTLGIYMTHFNDERFENGTSRQASRDLTELIMQQVTDDIRRNFEPDWTRRAMWNRSYAEARIPNVPTMLLELLSHQNFADMRYGLDPAFRFTVSRAIYKGMLKFIASQYNRPYVVQPLPVKDFAAAFSGDTEVELSWQPTPDPSEPSAQPAKYIVYTRIDGGGFDNGIVVTSAQCKLPIEKDKIYSYRVVAANDGGKSFPSEILSVCRRSNQKGEALIVNGFTRVSAPFSFTASNDSIAGFAGIVDNGVPYISDHHFTGQMHEFRRVIPWMDDDAAGFGDSNADYETTEIAGNTFDYPYVHGQGFAEAGYSFVSCSAAAVENGTVSLSKYRLVDWILGKQREWSVARGAMPPKYKTFSPKIQEIVTDYCNGGGNILISGAFVGSDFWDNPRATDRDRNWAEQTLKFKLRNGNGAVAGKIKSAASPFASIAGNYEYYNTLNSESYAVEHPDAIEPAGNNAYTVFRYAENNRSAGIIFKGEKYRSCVLGFPIEAIKDQHKKNELIGGILKAME
ncbi:MAG: xanthan lyase [Bacteroidota bacterium]